MDNFSNLVVGLYCVHTVLSYYFLGTAPIFSLSFNTFWGSLLTIIEYKQLAWNLGHLMITGPCLHFSSILSLFHTQSMFQLNWAAACYCFSASKIFYLMKNIIVSESLRQEDFCHKCPWLWRSFTCCLISKYNTELGAWGFWLLGSHLTKMG